MASRQPEVLRARSLVWGVGLLLTLATLVVLLFASGRDDAASGASASQRLPCTGADEPANFRHYSFGPSVDGHALNTMLRRCDAPYPGEDFRANYISYIYGTCEVPVNRDSGVAEGGCAPPLEIQTWPACERSHADYSYLGGPYPHQDIGPRRGVPATLFDEAERLELYTGHSTVVIFGNRPADVSAAVSAVRAEPKDQPPGPPLSVSERRATPLPRAAADLPQPASGATAGTLPCTG